MLPIREARHLQGIFFLPFFMTMCASMHATFTTLTLSTDLLMNSDLVFMTFGLFLTMRVPLTVYIPFSIQYIFEIAVVAKRFQTRDVVGHEWTLWQNRPADRVEPGILAVSGTHSAGVSLAFPACAGWPLLYVLHVL
ncbi:hypothetical protein BsWGS_03255 [Bradybaena similaris]